MVDIVGIFRPLGKLSPIDAGRWESFPCGNRYKAGLSVFNFAEGATLSILKKMDAGNLLSTVCVCTPYSKDIPMLYLRYDSGKLIDKLSIYTFDTCSCKCSSLPILDEVVKHFDSLLDLRKHCFNPGTDNLSCSINKFVPFKWGETMLYELLTGFLSCYADLLSRRPAYCNPENGDNTIVNKQQALFDKLFFLDDFSGRKLFKGIKIPDFEDFIDFIHFSGIPHMKISRSLLV